MRLSFSFIGNLMSKNMLLAMGSWPRIIVLLSIVAALAHATPIAKAQRAPAAAPVTLTTTLVKTGLFLISGGGANTLVRLSPAGLILVDGKLSDNYTPLIKKVKNISKFIDLPIQVVIVTNHNKDRCGTNTNFITARIPIIGQGNVTTNLSADHGADGKLSPPTITYARDYTLRLGGVEARLAHYGNAYSDDDTVVYFPNLKVVAVGDLFTPDTPVPDFSGGGSLLGWGPVLAQILKLDFDVAVPSKGPIVSRDDIIAFKTKIDILVARARRLIENGVHKDQLLAQLDAEDLGWRFRLTGENLDRFYAQLSSGKVVSDNPSR